jgi:hypothetical protein
MASKKVLVNIDFDGQAFLPNTATIEKSSILSSFLAGEVPTVRKWSGADLFTGADGALSYLAWVNLELIPNSTYQFVSPLSRNATFTPTFENFTDFDSLSFKLESDKMVVNGKLAMKFSVKEVLYQDLLNSKLLSFNSFGFRPKGSSDILVFTKYGADWAKEREDLARFMEGTSTVYLDNAPLVNVSKG